LSGTSFGGHIRYTLNSGPDETFVAHPVDGMPNRDRNLIRTSIPEKYDFSTKITTHVQLPVTSQCNYVVISLANRNGYPRNDISQKYSPRLNQVVHPQCKECVQKHSGIQRDSRPKIRHLIRRTPPMSLRYCQT